MADEVMAVAVNLVHTIADGRQISFGTAFAIDADRAVKNAVLDELAYLAERQAARAKRPALLADLRKHRETLAQFREDMARLEADWPTKLTGLMSALAGLEDAGAHELATQGFLEELNAQLAQIRKGRNDEFNAGFIEHQRTGRAGEYKPRGHRQANLERMDSAVKQAEEAAKNALVAFEEQHLRAIDEARDAITKAEAERDTALQHLGISEARYLQAIAVLEDELAEIDKLLEV